MSSKTNDAEAGEVIPISLDHLCVVHIVGEQAEDFLQRQTMNDLRSLARPGDAQWSGILSAKGRVLHFFRLVRTEAGYAAVLPRRDREAFISELLKFKFRTKVEFKGAERSPQGLWSRAGDAAWDARRSLIVDGSRGDPAAVEGSGATGEWMLEDWRSGILWIDDLARDRFTPQMLGLHRLHAFSLKKGCYPGQEIVARTHYLGKGKRDLARVQAEAPIKPGDAVLRKESQLGEVLGVLDCDASKAFAVLSGTAGENQADTLTTASGVALQVLELDAVDNR